MNAKVELDPSLFETTLRGTVVNQKQTKIADQDVSVVSNNMLVRVDSRDMDSILALIVPTSELQKHNIPSRDDWIEALTDQSENKFTWSNLYKDHMAKFDIGGQSIATFDNCQITTFQFDVKQTILTFHILVHGAKGADVGAIADVLGANTAIKIGRAKHWSAQMGLDIAKTPMQADVDPETLQKIERAKDIANKHNTDKANGRTKKNA